MPYGPADELRIATIKVLAAEAVEQANSGHPGAPLGMATLAYVLWDRFLRHDPADPAWPDRDRFVLSAGHASMLLYALLHLTGYDLSLDEIKRFRQWGSRTPGHPEHGLTPGVETTTGPLGQGFANGVGMAIAGAQLAARFNRPGHALLDHRVYGICSDGDLQEGVCAEAASLAGALGLGKIVYLYDDNGIQIEGRVDRCMREDVRRRFEAYGWHVAGPIDGHDPDAVEAAIREARAETARPSLVVCRTHIAFGAPTKQDTAAAHGEPLGAGEIRGLKEQLGWPWAEPFTIPGEVRAWADDHRDRGFRAHVAWDARRSAWEVAHPGLAAEFERALAGALPAGWDAGLDGLFAAGGKPVATRVASGIVLNHLAAGVPELVGGSADLAPSTKTVMDQEAHFLPGGTTGRNLHFGVREHAMGAIANGMAYHGGLRAYTATFLVFSDYMRPAVRLAAIAGLPVVHVFTHDSVGLGEDGPTHQPVEQLAALRAIPGYRVIRPCDAAETAAAWRAALTLPGPTALVLSRQNLPQLDRAAACAPAAGLLRGAYVLRDAPEPRALIMATGSEVHLALAAADLLAARGIAARVVSFPCWELFRAQPREYRDAVLPPALTARIAVEAGSPFGWREWVGDRGAVVGLERFGASAPGETVLRELGFTAERVAGETLDLLGETR